MLVDIYEKIQGNIYSYAIILCLVEAKEHRILQVAQYFVFQNQNKNNLFTGGLD
jgi:hypothetical protein